LTQMDRRTNNESKMRLATKELTEFYSEFEQDFTIFFEEIRAYTNQKLIS
jgi:acyl carrier protein phosphodiesterase